MHAQSDIFKQSSSFENDYLVRTIGAIGRSPDSALTELVANAWDAGSTEAKIIIPSQELDYLTIEDDGVGMSEQEFIARWMKLGYNRIQHQGSDVEFPSEKLHLKRKAYGQYGLGRHGLLCFSDEYEVETWKNGIGNFFKISTLAGENPFVVTSSRRFSKEGHGTLLRVRVARRLPDPDSMRHILAARFLHDPSFQILVNGYSVNLLELQGYIEDAEIIVNQKIKLRGYAIDSTKIALTKQRQGAAFWVNGRLVGQVGWNIGQKNIIDGRTSFGRKFVFIFQSSDLSEYVLPDWSGFENSEEMDLVYDKAADYVKSVLKNYNAQRMVETKQEIIRKNKKQIRELSPLGQIEVENFLNTLMELDPTAGVEILMRVVQLMPLLLGTKSKQSLQRSER